MFCPWPQELDLFISTRIKAADICVEQAATYQHIWVSVQKLENDPSLSPLQSFPSMSWPVWKTQVVMKAFNARTKTNHIIIIICTRMTCNFTSKSELNYSPGQQSHSWHKPHNRERQKTKTLEMSLKALGEACGTADPGGAHLGQPPWAPAKCRFQHDFTKQPEIDDTLSFQTDVECTVDKLKIKHESDIFKSLFKLRFS